jgi:branched-chain amino acid transport system ATP-binding protein
MNAEPILAADDLTVFFGPLCALDGVSVSVGLGEILSLIGPNGAGKTTLLNAVSGLLPLRRGQVRIDGRDVTSDPPNRRSLAGLKRTFQHARLVDELSVVENVLIGASSGQYPQLLFGEWLRLPRSRDALGRQRERALDLLAGVGLEGLAQVPVGQLSFGRKKLVDLARAMMASPRILLMDEPTAGLTEPEIESLVTLIEQVRQEVAILLVAHHMGFVATVANRVVCLVTGRAISSGTPRDVQTDPNVLAA